MQRVPYIAFVWEVGMLVYSAPKQIITSGMIWAP